ncbi:aldo/keto reductase [Flexivirga oryzae]|uniref:Aryl-alcohol dehydrogenase-like predicted oxidoreductase n=1 Tax=Flexivirga oryzae TaxID=1794944 RepID=A0A839N1B3_9MICO|nr:aldo/keto reductase [Flexivirga oryzae]MBB2891540.1 aryl-alcohol dehydrogenase-like predicted oxidoreductase [Flexivirga oryzae]
MSVAKLGLGLAAVGRPAYITSGRAGDLGGDRSPESLRRRAAQVLDAGYDAGIRYIDVARSYGLAESFVASWLADHPDLDVVVASKWGYTYVGGWRIADDITHEVKDHSGSAFDKQLQESLVLLGANLRVYQVHSVTPDSPVLIDRTLQEALARLRDREIRVGFSTSGPRQADVIRAALDISVGGRRLFEVVQSTWNLLEQSAETALTEASRLGLDVVVKECLANGRLVDDTDETDDPDPRLPELRAVAQRLGIGLDQLAMATALAAPWADHVLCGAVTTEQVERARAAAAFVLPGESIVAARAVPQDAEQYWHDRSARPWA